MSAAALPEAALPDAGTSDAGTAGASGPAASGPGAVRRVAVVGSGPAGVYATEALLDAGISVDVLDRLPAPFGLVRYGVAPDHLKIKSIAATLATVLADDRVRLFGNVEVGTDVTVPELRDRYDGVLFANGASVDRRLGIDGEDLPGSFSATDFVSWYCGHPDAPVDRFTLEASSVAVIGAGNVAVDVARVLLRSAGELHATDMPHHVVDVLEASAITDVHIVVRRGPTQTRISTVELRELGRVENADVVVDPASLVLDPDVEAALDSPQRRNIATLREWSTRPVTGRSRRLHLHFHRRPVALLGQARVAGLELERTAPAPDGRVVGTGEHSVLAAQMVLRAVGYHGSPVPGMPFDTSTGVIPNDGGRVLRDGVASPGEYVAGWVKRGPTGVIGTNKHDARETVAALLTDLAGASTPPAGGTEALRDLLHSRGVETVDWIGWKQIEAAEAEHGRGFGRDRVKIADRAVLLAAARSAAL